MQEFFHQLAMWLIFLGALALIYLAFVWFDRGNTIMGFGMLIMGIIASSNFYLHRKMMQRDKGK